MSRAVVELTLPEICLGTIVGSARRWFNGTKGSKKFQDWTGDPLMNDIESSRAELAVAKHLNLYWTGALDPKLPDVGINIQVRHSQRKDPSLLIREADDDTHIFILVTGCAGSYELIGWCTGAMAKNPQYLRDPGGRGQAWFFPSSKLNDINLLSGNAT